jgi:hypothetical protein
MESRTDTLGFGHPSAPIGSESWAQWWRTTFQHTVNSLGMYPETAKSLYESGNKHRAWAILRNPNGLRFRTFQEFCETPKPHGLELDYATFIAYLEARYGKEAVQLMTVPPDGRQMNGRKRQATMEEIFATEQTPSPVDSGHYVQNQQERFAGEPNGNNGTSQHTETKVDSATELQNQNHETTRRLRAINRAPLKVQELYRDGYLSQVDAARLGPEPPQKEKAEESDDKAKKKRKHRRNSEREARQEERRRCAARATAEIDCLDRSLPKPEFRKQARAIIQRELGGKEKTTVDVLLAAWGKATADERAEFLKRAGLVLKRP